MNFFAVKNTKQKTVKFLAVLLTFYAVLPVSQAFAITSNVTHNGDNLVVTVNDNDFTANPCVESFPPFNVPVVGYQVKVFENNGGPYDPDAPDLFSPVYTGDSVSTFYVPADFDVIAVLVSCVPANPGDQYYSHTLESGLDFDPFAFPDPFVYNTLYTITGSGNTSVFFDSDDVPVGPGPSSALHFSLVGTSTSFLDKISTPMVASVQTTGANLWPLFAFVGVSLAFIIALQLLVFTKRATGVSNTTLEHKTRSRGRKNPYSDPLHPDHKAFERGKKANKADGIDLFPDDK